MLTAFSGQLGIQDCIRLLDGYWERVDRHGRDRNPFRGGIAVIPVVGESMAQIERDYAKHIHYFFQGTTGIYNFSPTNHYGITQNPYVLATIAGGKVKIVK